MKNVDQTAVNYVFYPNIGRLPSKFGIFNFRNELDIEKYISFLRQKVNIMEIKKAFKDPAIIHLVLCSPKPWIFPSSYYKKYSRCSKSKNCSCIKYHNLWHDYANKTSYYDEIIKFIGGRVNH